MKISLIAAVTLSLAGIIITLISFHKKVPEKTGLQGVSNIIIYTAAFGAIASIVLIIFHVKHIGLPLLNISLALFIIGVITLMASLSGANNTAVSPVLKRKSIVYNTLICLGVICTVIGMILKINHYPFGKGLIYGGVSFVMAVLLFIIVYMRYIKKKAIR